MSERPFLSHFSPQWTKPEYLESILVQRGDLLAESTAVVREGVLTGRRQHLLFVGPRGAGKTHLVSLIQHRLSQDPELADRMRVAWLNEDETATSFLRLLISIYRSLTDRYPGEFPADTITALTRNEPKLALEQLGHALQRDLHGRTVVCIMENLDSLFRSLSEAEQRNWRAFLQNHPIFVMVGTAQALFDGIADHDEPFYGFFDTRHLRPLSADDARDLLERIARLHDRSDLVDFLQTPVGRARVDAVRALAGGNPRLYLIFSDLLVDAGALDDLVRPFEEMVDRQLTSYYQERLRWLSPQQREIIQFLCRSHGTVPVRQIAEGLFTTHNSITGQLKQLREMRYVDSHPLGREVFYELAEPLMRLALQVKETHDRRPLALIVDFLRVWHEQGELEQRLAACSADSPSRVYLEEACRLLLTEPNIRHELYRRELKLIANPDECDENMVVTAECLANESNHPADWIWLGLILNIRKEWKKAVDILTKVIRAVNASPFEVATALFGRGNAYFFTGVLDQAIDDFNQIVELTGAPANMIALAFNSRGACHRQSGRIAEAISDFTRAIELPGAQPDQISEGFNFRGNCYEIIDGIADAIADYTSAIELAGAPPSQVSWALCSRGICRGRAGLTSEAVIDIDRAICLPGASPSQIARALNIRSIYYMNVGCMAEAVIDLTHVIEMRGVLPEQVALALNSRGICYCKAGRATDGLAEFTNAMELEGVPSMQVALACSNRAVCHAENKQHESVLHDLRLLFTLSDQNAVREVVSYRLNCKTKNAVTAGFACTTDALRWKAILAEFAGYFTRFDGLSQFGEAAVKHLPALAQSPLNHAAWDAWADAWEAARDALPEPDRDKLDIPLRLLRTGITWLKTKNDGCLLMLPREERRILREALQLPPEKE